MTSPGVPMIFQGQELLDDQTFSFPTGTAPRWSNLQSQTGIVRLYRDLILLRRNVAGTTRGLLGQREGVSPRRRQQGAGLSALVERRSR